jgi:4'-phosphopantetheinyl transferase
MIAVTHGRKLGVDVEYQRSVRNMGGIVQRFSADIERLVWQVNPTVEQFYDLWTQKEAYVKAIGRGLSYPLHAFSMITTRGEGWQEHTIPNENKVPEQWSVYRFAPAPHYLGALVVEGHADALRMFSFTTV